MFGTISPFLQTVGCGDLTSEASSEKRTEIDGKDEGPGDCRTGALSAMYRYVHGNAELTGVLWRLRISIFYRFHLRVRLYSVSVAYPMTISPPCFFGSHSAAIVVLPRSKPLLPIGSELAS